MGAVDPKDMTASELLRWAANDDEYISPIDGNSWTTCSGKLKSFVEWESGDWPKDARLCDCLADKIDAEIEAALLCASSDAFLEKLDKRIEMYGYPSRKNETLAEWLERCFIPRPRFEDGEPVQFGDATSFTDGVLSITSHNTGAVDLYGWGGEREEHAGRCLVKRLAPEVLGADGKPIKDGETVWLDEAHSRCAGSYGFEDGNKYSLCGIERQEMLRVEDAHIEVDRREYVRFCTCGAWCHASWLTHTPPDTQQQIDDDATMPPAEYCAVRGIDLGDDPDREAATTTMVHDLLARQRRVIARGGDQR